MTIEEAKKAIKEEIKEAYGGCYICEYDEDYDYEENDISDYYAIGSVEDIIDIIEKHLSNIDSLK